MISRLALTLNSTVPEGRLFALDQQTLISAVVLLFNFCILAAILGLILYKPVQKYMLKRTERISRQIEDAQNKMARAEELEAEYEAKLTEIAAERAAALESARMEAAERGRQVLDEARNEAAIIKQRAEESILVEKERLKKETWQYIVEISSMMTEKLVHKTIDSEVHDKLFAEAMAELEETPWPS
ncbi:MAG: ATP synthase F0 subunit B [Candidatus Pelethousia sp.]|nr:ATP synthase F0 subunit B [Candidatus Pelethousia sp.]